MMGHVRHILPPRLTTGMDDEELQGFSGIWECPWENWKRGVYADWLDEHGRPVDAAHQRCLRSDLSDDDRMGLRLEYSQQLHAAGRHDLADFIYAQVVLDRLPDYVDIPNAWEAVLPGEKEARKAFRIRLDDIPEDRKDYPDVRELIRNRERYAHWCSDLLARIDQWNPTLPAVFGRTRIKADWVYSGGTSLPPGPRPGGLSPHPRAVLPGGGGFGHSIGTGYHWGMLERITAIMWDDWATCWRNVMYWEPVRSVKLYSLPMLSRERRETDGLIRYTLHRTGRWTDTLPEPQAEFLVEYHYNDRMMWARDGTGVEYRLNLVTDLLKKTWPTVDFDLSALSTAQLEVNGRFA